MVYDRKNCSGGVVRMKTLIELFDERPIENVLASEVFAPETTVFLCPEEIASNREYQRNLNGFFKRRGLKLRTVFLKTELYYADRVAEQIVNVTNKYSDCVLEITGGSDAALFGAGMICEETGLPVFTYSIRRNRFYSILGADFVNDVPCRIEHSVEDCFLMAGGSLRQGRVDNSVLGRYLSYFDGFMEIYLDHKREWSSAVNYVQRASQTEKGAPVSLHVRTDYTLKGDRGRRLDCPEELLRELEKLGFLQKLRITRQEVSFDFLDAQVRIWLRDTGSVLELYTYKCCLDAGIFHDVVTSAVVDWEKNGGRDTVTNEIDVMATVGIHPLFISCKTCDITTEALNELAILRDRFGGSVAKAAIVTTQGCRSITRHRAAELAIFVIDADDIKAGRVTELLRGLMD